MSKNAHEQHPGSILDDPAPLVQDDLHAQVMLGRLRVALTGSTDPVRIGRFDVGGVLGSGGMGIVYAAEDPNLGRPVALKVIEGGGSTQHRWLLDEARALARVRHDAVVQVYEADVVDDAVYIAMEYVGGRQLDRWLDAERPAVGAILDVFRRAGEGLATAHAADVVHGDFKPSNVLIDADGAVKVIDFGLARIASESRRGRGGAALDGSAGLTVAGAGTPAYMAPEQLRGEGADARADQFSFCVALFEALTGRRPFFGATAAEHIDRVCRGQLDDRALNKVPKYLRAPLRRGLDSDPDQRFESMPALLAALAPRSRRRYVIAGAVGLAVAVVVGWQMVRADRAPFDDQVMPVVATRGQQVRPPVTQVSAAKLPAARRPDVIAAPRVMANSVVRTPAPSHIHRAVAKPARHKRRTSPPRTRPTVVTPPPRTEPPAVKTEQPEAPEQPAAKPETNPVPQPIVKQPPPPPELVPPSLDVRLVNLRNSARSAAAAGSAARCGVLLQQALAITPEARRAGGLETQMVTKALDSVSKCLAAGGLCNTARLARRRYLQLRRAAKPASVAAAWAARQCKR